MQEMNAARQRLEDRRALLNFVGLFLAYTVGLPAVLFVLWLMMAIAAAIFN